jgi:outer membrane protein TolC
MTRWWFGGAALTCLLTATTAQAETLTLQRAIAMALSGNADVNAARAAQAEAGAQQDAAARAWMPRVTVEEGWQRGDQPVFAFSSLLAQRRFAEADFAVQTLNHPDPISNHRAALLLQQSIFDGGDTRAGARAAKTARALAGADYRRTEADTVVAVAQAYGDAMIAASSRRAARAAIESALRDVERAESRQASGMATAADVLSLKVHLAGTQAREVSAAGDLLTARARLNSLLGVGVDTEWQLTEPDLVERPTPVSDGGIDSRADVMAAALRVDAADAAARQAHALLLPRVAVEGGYEWNGSTWSDRAAAWFVGVRAALSLSLGGAEAARAKAAAHAVERARAQKASVERAAQVDVVAARARLEAARARQDIAAGSLTQARESARIIRSGSKQDSPALPTYCAPPTPCSQPSRSRLPRMWTCSLRRSCSTARLATRPDPRVGRYRHDVQDTRHHPLRGSGHRVPSQLRSRARGSLAGSRHHGRRHRATGTTHI